MKRIITPNGNGGSRINIPWVKPKKARLGLTTAVIVTISITLSGWIRDWIVRDTTIDVQQTELMAQVSDHEDRLEAVEKSQVEQGVVIGRVDKCEDRINEVEKLAERLDERTERMDENIKTILEKLND